MIRTRTEALRRVLAALLAAAPFPGLAEAAADDGEHFFERRVRPLLAEHCYGCHSQESGKSKGSLLLDSRQGWEAGGDSGPAIVPGDPDGSLLIRAVRYDDPDLEMPPKGRLPQEAVGILEAWVRSGAPDPRQGEVRQAEGGIDLEAGRRHWAFRPPVFRGVPPEEPARSAIDAFLLQDREEGSVPARAPYADIVRRLHFDLAGLPPDPELLEQSGEASLEAMVDRLLASPRFGETWGRHWLDLARYSESTGGGRSALLPNAWRYRNYVIDSFNRDKPYDRLVREHLAGDQLAGGDPGVEVGTGFLVGGAYDDVGNQDPIAAKLIRANTIDDMINATASSFLGLTVSCARCHDHKFDPIPQTDYYRMQSAFAGVQQGSRPLATAAERERHQARLGPLEEAISESEERHQAVREQVLERIRPRLEEVRRTFVRPKVDPYLTEETFPPVEARFVRIRIDRTTRGPYHGAVIDEFEVWTPGEDPVNVALAAHGSEATASSMRTSEDNPLAYSASKAIDGAFGEYWISQRNGGVLTVRLAGPRRVARVAWSNDRPREYQRHLVRPFSSEYAIEVSLDGEAWTRVAGSEGREPYDQAHLEDILFEREATLEERRMLGEMGRERNRMRQELRAVAPLPDAWIGSFRQPGGTTRLARGGDPAREGPEVAPASLRALAPLGPGYALEAGAPEAERRLELARWIARPGNALFARVMANRLWHYHFGTGIVATPSDFGAGGALPSHPRLLDWLAGQLVRHGFRLKPIHRIILGSHAWRQDSRPDAAMQALDQSARFLWRYPPRRLEAEAIRDAILLVSGSLDTRMGGPGFRLYRYTVDNVATYIPLDEHGPETFRRGVYHQHVRAVEVDFLSDFDCPDPALPAPRRNATTSPQQAMSLQNHSFVQDQSRRWAERLLAHGGRSEDQVRLAFLSAFGREPSGPELEESLALVRDHGLALLCRALLNANEFIHVR